MLVVARRMVVVLDKPEDVYTDWEGLSRFYSLFCRVQLNVISVIFRNILGIYRLLFWSGKYYKDI
jgi:hypothetical protein